MGGMYGASVLGIRRISSPPASPPIQRTTSSLPDNSRQCQFRSRLAHERWSDRYLSCEVHLSWSFALERAVWRSEFTIRQLRCLRLGLEHSARRHILWKRELWGWGSRKRRRGRHLRCEVQPFGAPHAE